MVPKAAATSVICQFNSHFEHKSKSKNKRKIPNHRLIIKSRPQSLTIS